MDIECPYTFYILLNNKMSAEILQVFLLLRNQIKIYHWQTLSYARHKATDDLVEKIDSQIDRFTEVYMGKYGRPHFTAKNSSLKIYDVTDAMAASIISESIKWMQNVLPTLLSKNDTDLLAIRDELLADLNQTLYVFTLK
jgi:DNA-binding ferritin-like protein